MNQRSTRRGGPPLTVAVATRNRPASLLRCLLSLTAIDDLVSQIIVADDNSDVPAERLRTDLPPALASRVVFLRREHDTGSLVGRNDMIRGAATEFVLSMDDDAFLLTDEGIRRALGMMQRQPRVAAVAFAQGLADGSPWPPHMQPAPVSYPCRVAAFIGFAHLVRRSAFVELGGYPEAYVFYGEEKDYCIRALDAGYDVVFLPDVVVAHVPDASGRSPIRYLRQVIRNDCLFALYHEPWPIPLVTIPIRLRRYFVMRGNGTVDDRGGFRWILRTLVAGLPDALRRRRAVRWATIREWRRLGREWPRFVDEEGS